MTYDLSRAEWPLAAIAAYTLVPCPPPATTDQHWHGRHSSYDRDMFSQVPEPFSHHLLSHRLVSV